MITSPCRDVKICAAEAIPGGAVLLRNLSDSIGQMTFILKIAFLIRPLPIKGA